MKYGLDIENSYLRNEIAQCLKNHGHLVIDMNEFEYLGAGEKLFKKVILANQSQVEIYIYVSISEGKEEVIRITGDDTLLAKRFYENFLVKKDNISFKVPDYMVDESYYVINNIKNSVVFFEINTRRDGSIKEILPLIIDALTSLS